MPEITDEYIKELHLRAKMKTVENAVEISETVQTLRILTEEMSTPENQICVYANAQSVAYVLSAYMVTKWSESGEDETFVDFCVAELTNALVIYNARSLHLDDVQAEEAGGEK